LIFIWACLFDLCIIPGERKVQTSKQARSLNYVRALVGGEVISLKITPVTSQVRASATISVADLTFNDNYFFACQTLLPQHGVSRVGAGYISAILPAPNLALQDSNTLSFYGIKDGDFVHAAISDEPPPPPPETVIAIPSRRSITAQIFHACNSAVRATTARSRHRQQWPCASNFRASEAMTRICTDTRNEEWRNTERRRLSAVWAHQAIPPLF
jgi:hypothetical protein